MNEVKVMWKVCSVVAYFELEECLNNHAKDGWDVYQVFNEPANWVIVFIKDTYESKN